jgi:pimeloyl-ACP methyl ester carboxylesterase
MNSTDSIYLDRNLTPRTENLDRRTPDAPKFGSTLFFIHGICGGSWYFDNYLNAAVAAGWDTCALNLRGHGDSVSTADLDDVSVMDYVADVRAVLDSIGAAILVGHSVGGLIAQKVASLEESRVRGAVFLCSAPPKGISALSWPLIRRFLAPRYLAAVATGRTFKPREAHIRDLALNRIDRVTAGSYVRRFGPESGRVAREFVFSRVAVDERTVMCPTLVVGAECDRILPPRVQRKIARKYGADLISFPGRGHMLSLEDPWERSAVEILAWSAKIDRRFDRPSNGANRIQF